MTWYVDHSGCRWRLCSVVAHRLGYVIVKTYDGETLNAVARNGKYYEKEQS